MKKRFLHISAVFLFLLCASQASAFFNSLDVPETMTIRKNIVQTWLEAPIEVVSEKRPEIKVNSTAQVFQVRTEQIEGYTAIVISPRQEDYTFPLEVIGSWALLRDSTSGAPYAFRYYFDSNGVYAQLRPRSPKNVLDFIVFDAYLAYNVPINHSIGELYTMSFYDVVNITTPLVPWQYTRIDPRLYYYNLYLAESIRENLPTFTYVEDAGYNEYGEPVYLSSGTARKEPEGMRGVDTYGFSKWVVDGLVEPIAGGYTKIKPLTEQTLEFSAAWEEELAIQKETFKALNWCRNLGAAMSSTDTGSKRKKDVTIADVNQNFFSTYRSADGPVRTEGYTKNTGFNTSLIQPLLYVMAVLYPDRFYLAAIRNPQDAPGSEVAPFNRIAVLIPYFDAAFGFDITVFENGKEMTFDEFLAEHEGSSIHLSNLKSTDRFFPVAEVKSR